MTKVNIYYGGRGLIEDPTIYVMDKITEVLNELNVVVRRYNLYEDKKGISVLPKTLKEADDIGGLCGVVRNWWISPAVFGCLLVVW